MSRLDPIKDAGAKVEAARDDIVPAKPAGFQELSVKVDLTGFDDPKQTLVIEAWEGQQRIARMEAQGGPRPTENIAGEKVANPDLLVFTTASNREHKGDVKVTTTVIGDARQKAPIEVLTR